MHASRKLEIFRWVTLARAIEERERALVAQGHAFFYMSGEGHEANAALAFHLTKSDWLFPHYRDKALLLARGIQVAEFFRALLGKAGAASSGRQMNTHLSDPELKIPGMSVPVGNSCCQAVGVAAAIRGQSERPIVVCCIGDGTTQQGEFYEAVAEAVRWKLPVLFLIENNHWSISTSTRRRTFFDLPTGPAAELFGIPIRRVNGTDILSVDAALGTEIHQMRELRCPGLILLDVERLQDHSNADDHNRYRSQDELNYSRLTGDPLPGLRNTLLRDGITEEELCDLERDLCSLVERIAQEALREADPVPVRDSIAPYPNSFRSRVEYRGNSSLPRLTLREALAGVLHARLASDMRTFLYGQDIEDPKGDVFGVTRGLSTIFPGRVVNAPLSESTIVGTAIGRALAGQRPVIFIQFADFLPVTFNQIVSELGTMFWRTNGCWQCPVILMVSCGGYKPGLGPFHSQTMEGFAAHIPGIDVVMPSSAGDAAGLLNAAFESSRPTIFFYPKSCLNRPDRMTSSDVAQQFVLPGTVRRLSNGSDITLVTWGNPVAQCEQAVAVLADAGFAVDLFDLRSLSPWDESAIVSSVDKTGRLVVVHEDNHTGGFGAEVLATVAEKARRSVQVRRVTRPDAPVPFHFGNQLDLLPSFRSVLEALADLLNCDVTWKQPLADPPGETTIRAIGSGPADEAVDIVAVLVEPGDRVHTGQVVAEAEATKSIVEICATSGGNVAEVLVQVGQRVSVNAGLLRIKTDNQSPAPQPPVTMEVTGTPQIMRRRLTNLSASASQPTQRTTIGIAAITGVTGSRVVTNEELLSYWPGRTAADIVQRTGIESRRWIGPDETVLSLAIAATRQLLTQQRLSIHDIDLVIACTTTPDVVTPSLACRVAAALTPSDAHASLAAYDINAACSGYLYALSQAWDYLQQSPMARVLVVTSEVLSPLLNLNDFDTAILFGDAATATLIIGEGRETPWLTLNRPILSGNPDSESRITVPLCGTDRLAMQGSTVFRDAVRSMNQILHQACQRDSTSIDDLELVVPHQANQRIIDAVATRCGRQVLSHLREVGNTSSSSIPLALYSHREQLPDGPIGVVAFGGGEVFGAATCCRRQKL